MKPNKHPPESSANISPAPEPHDLGAAALSAAAESPPSDIDYAVGTPLVLSEGPTMVEGFALMTTYYQAIIKRLDPVQQHLVQFVDIEHGTLEAFVAKFGKKYKTLTLDKAAQEYQYAQYKLEPKQNLHNHPPKNSHGRQGKGSAQQLTPEASDDSMAEEPSSPMPRWTELTMRQSHADTFSIGDVRPGPTNADNHTPGTTYTVVELYKQGKTTKEQITGARPDLSAEAVVKNLRYILVVKELRQILETAPGREQLPSLLDKPQPDIMKIALCCLHGLNFDDIKDRCGIERNQARSLYRAIRVVAGLEHPMPDPNKEQRQLLESVKKMEQITILAELRYSPEDMRRILGEPFPDAYYKDYQAIIELVRPWRILPIASVLRHEIQALPTDRQQIERMSEYRLTPLEMRNVCGLSNEVISTYLWRQAVFTSFPAPAQEKLSSEEDALKLLTGSRTNVEKIWRLMPYRRSCRNPAVVSERPF